MNNNITDKIGTNSIKTAPIKDIPETTNRRDISIQENITTTPKKLSVIPNIDTPWQTMGRPAYYKNPRIEKILSWFWELALKADKLPASPIVKVRPEVETMLNNIQKRLDNDQKYRHLKLVVVDWYRPQSLQKELYEIYKEFLTRSNKDWDENRLEQETQKMVSKPSYDPLVLAKSPPPHSTWGSVDVVLVEKSKIDITKDDRIHTACIDFWADFDEMMHEEYWDQRSLTVFFENNQENISARDNRRLLYSLMTEEGFSNYSTERRHYDYGNQFAASRIGEEATFWFVAWIDETGNIVEDLSAEEEALNQYQKVVGASAEELMADFWLPQVA